MWDPASTWLTLAPISAEVLGTAHTRLRLNTRPKLHQHPRQNLCTHARQLAQRLASVCRCSAPNGTSSTIACTVRLQSWPFQMQTARLLQAPQTRSVPPFYTKILTLAVIVSSFRQPSCITWSFGLRITCRRRRQLHKEPTFAWPQVVRSQSRSEALLETLTRVLLLPLYLAVFLIELPQRVIYSEPEGYGLCKWAEPYCEGARPHLIQLLVKSSML